jgi:DNA-repair protein XRCC1
MPRPLDGLSFALSGFVNPERGSLRQMGVDLGAKYDPEWTPATTHLICAIAGTPKAMQVCSRKCRTAKLNIYVM